MVLETKIVLIIGVGGVGCLLLGALVWYLMHQRQEMEKRLLAMRQLRTAQAHLKLQQQQQLQLQQQQQQPDFRFHSPDLRGVQQPNNFEHGNLPQQTILSQPPTPMGLAGGVQYLTAGVQPNTAPASDAGRHVELQLASTPANRFNVPAQQLISNAAAGRINNHSDTDVLWSQLRELEMTAATSPYGGVPGQIGQGWDTHSQLSSQRPMSLHSSRGEKSGAQTPISMFMSSGVASRVGTPSMAQMGPLGESEFDSEEDNEDLYGASFGSNLSELAEKVGITPFVPAAALAKPKHQRTVSFGDDIASSEAGMSQKMSQQEKREAAVARHTALGIKAKAEAEANAQARTRTISFGDERAPEAGMSQQEAAVAKHAALGLKAKAEAEANAKTKATENAAAEDAVAVAAAAEAEAQANAATAEAEAQANAEAEAVANAKAKAAAEERHAELAAKAKRDAEANALAKQLAEEQAAEDAAQKLLDDAEAAEIATAREAASKLEQKRRLDAEEQQYKTAQAKREKERLAKIALEQALENKRLKEEEEARRVAEETRLEEERRAELEAAKEAELAYDRKLKEKMEQKKASESEARENAQLAREEKKRVDAENSKIAKEEKAQKKIAKLQALSEKKRLAAESEERAHQERLSQMSSTEKKLYLEQVEQQRKEAEFSFRSTYFASGDADGDGMLSFEEALQQGMDESTFRAIDADGNGQLTLEEFADWQVRNRPKGDFMG